MNRTLGVARVLPLPQLELKMLITRKSMFTGIEHTLDLPVTQEQFDRYARGWLIQDAFPELTPAEREFIKTGITPEEWHAGLPPQENDEC